METPLISSIGKDTANNTLYEWQTDSLGAVTSNPRLEGDTFAGAAITPTTRLQNYTQIEDQRITVSGTAQSVKTAGRRNEYTYQVMRASRRLKLVMEKVLVSNQAPVAGNSTTA